MQQAIIHADLSVTFDRASSIPTPTDWQVVIKAETASINPVDWKAASRKNTSNPAPGKDFAGVVHSVGLKVSQFKPGDRVGALNVSSGFAEYSVAPSSSTFKLPDHITFEEAAAFGLPYYTAALGMFKGLPSPAPWNPARPSDYNPLVIYGASSAVGAYAVKLAVLANIHPIIAIAGAAAKETISSVLKPELGDTVIDYREHDSSESLVVAIQNAAWKSKTVKYAFDVIGTDYTINKVLAHVLDPDISYLSNAVPSSFTFNVPAKTVVSMTFAPGVFMPSDPEGEKGSNGKNNVGSRAFMSVATRYLEFALGEGLINAHPLKVLPNGLSSLQEGLQDLKEGRNRSLKYIMRVNDTEW